MLNSSSSSEQAVHLHDFLERGAAVRGLLKALLSGAPIHAVLLVGPRGVGRETLATLAAQALHCTAEGERPCGNCPACMRYLAKSHPDAHMLKAEKRISVDDIRALVSELSNRAFEGGKKTVRIIDAGSMTVQAQNSLLKTLEEPPGDTVFFLTAVALPELLPTIRSRCRIVHIPPMSDEQVRDILASRGIDAARAAQVAALSGGSIGNALSMQEDASFWALHDRVSEAMERVVSPASVWEAVHMLKDDKADAQRIADLLEGAVRNALRAGVLDAHELGMPWERTLMRADARALMRLLEGVLSMRKRLASNVPWQAALERFVLEYAEERVAWQS